MDIPTAQALLSQALADANAGTYPSTRFSGHGIVIPAGGERLLTCAYVAIKRLRELGCTLPIELWQTGPDEMTPEWQTVLATLSGVTLVDASVVYQTYPVGVLAGFAFKPYPIINSSFAEVIYMDADCVATRDPALLLESAEYQQTGILLWPDAEGSLSIRPDVWTITGLTKPAGPEMESGQMVFDKARAWKALQVANHFNLQHEFYDTILFGDKDTFWLGCMLTGTPYSVVPGSSLSPNLNTHYHNGTDGQRLFQHRAAADYSLYYDEAVGGFEQQTECNAALAGLRTALDALNYWQTPMGKLNPCNLAARTMRVLKPSYGESRMNFDHAGAVVNATFHETRFVVARENMQTVVIIKDENGDASLRFWLYMNGVQELWIGQYQFADRLPVVMTPAT